MATNVVMSSSTAVDLALLGLLVERPCPVQDLVVSIKMVSGDHFTPTAEFIAGRMAHLIQSDHLAAQGERLTVTPPGRVHLRRLLRLDIDPRVAALRGFGTTLNVCLLDVVGLACRREVAAGLVAAGRRRAADGPVAGFRLAFGLSGVEAALASFEGWVRSSAAPLSAQHRDACARVPVRQPGRDGHGRRGRRLAGGGADRGACDGSRSDCPMRAGDGAAVRTRARRRHDAASAGSSTPCATIPAAAEASLSVPRRREQGYSD